MPNFPAPGGANLPGMNPIIAAALIALGGSITSLLGAVGVAISGYRNTKKVTEKTVQASTGNTIRALDAARGDRLWDKQATAYVDAIAGVRWQQLRRQRQLNTLDPGDPLPADKSPVDWDELEARLLAYASPAVLLALKTASDAGRKARDLYNTWTFMADDERRSNDLRGAGIAAPARPAQILIDAAEAVRPAIQHANDKDDALIDAIRTDLHGKAGRALALLSSAPADS